MISVIVPVYKVEPYLHKCIDSILDQTYRELEVLLIDDGSPDRCGEICDEYERRDERVRVFHTENRGLSAARNLGLKEARGKYIGFVDSDDWIEPDMYEMLLKRLEETGADICVCGYFYENGTRTTNTTYENTTYYGLESVTALINEKISNNVWNKLYCKDCFTNVRFPEARNFEDTAVMHIIFSHSYAVSISDKLAYHYRFRMDSITKDYSARNLIDYAYVCISRYSFFKDELPEITLDNEDVLLRSCAKAISRVWRWWFGCHRYEKRKHIREIEEIWIFTTDHFSLFGNSEWPVSLRLSVFFMHSKCLLSFAMIYGLNQLYRMVYPLRSNVDGNRHRPCWSYIFD